MAKHFPASKLALTFFLICRILVWRGNSQECQDNIRLPQKWAEVGRVSPSEQLVLTFALKQQNVDLLEETLGLVSDPDSAQYGKHLTLEEVSVLVRPSAQTQKVVFHWLKSHGVTDCQTIATLDFLQCTMTTEVAEMLLPGSKFYRYNEKDVSVLWSSSPYTVPDYVLPHLDFISGLLGFAPKTLAFRDASSGRKRMPSPWFHLGITPAILRECYNLTAADVGSAQNNSQAVVQFLEQYFRPSDLSEFMKLFGKGFHHRSKVDRVVGTQGSGRATIEATLDVQYIMSSGANISTWVFTNPGRHESQEPFLQWMMLLSNMSDLPSVHTISYGDQEDTLTTDYMMRINTEFMKAGVRGMTLLFSSGDDGTDCKYSTESGNVFRPMFPASSPYVTAVGGTKFKNPFKVSYEVSNAISGGGFSNVFKMPDYQVSAVDGYLKAAAATGLPPQKYFNASGRAYPDIAALSDNFWVVLNRAPLPWISGTSASAPVVGGIVALINDQRLLKGLPVLGFLNPRLYKLKGRGLFDVTEGCQKSCLDEQLQGRGFCAAPSWDPVTGWGTPNYPTLLAALTDK